MPTPWQGGLSLRSARLHTMNPVELRMLAFLAHASATRKKVSLADGAEAARCDHRTAWRIYQDLYDMGTVYAPHLKLGSPQTPSIVLVGGKEDRRTPAPVREPLQVSQRLSVDPLRTDPQVFAQLSAVMEESTRLNAVPKDDRNSSWLKEMAANARMKAAILRRIPTRLCAAEANRQEAAAFAFEEQAEYRNKKG